MVKATMFLALSILPGPAPTPANLRKAIESALTPLIAGATGHAEQKTCFACHNQAAPMLAFAAARPRGFQLPTDLFRSQAEHISQFLETNRTRFRDGRGTGGQVATAGYALWTLELAGHKADDNTAAVVEYLLKTQAERDHWRTTSNRPPTEASHFTTTYLALRALRVWGPAAQADAEKVNQRRANARQWLMKTTPRDTEDRVFRLLALKEAGADDKEIAAAAWDLLQQQRSDGGWAQLSTGASDAYATGTALVALYEAGRLKTQSPASQAGLAFLLKTQRRDGTWLVKSRSRPFQPYYESGFPHEKNQFISIAASGWATTALALALNAQ
ncbi:MAG: hypothetical protein RMJ56_16845 [Gemmataceae bacterium]|nr:hypothetical protein [Gemmata sp.]MDW8199267.1 hypothetical protein [Gemmataceae bacterium]